MDAQAHQLAAAFGLDGSAMAGLVRFLFSRIENYGFDNFAALPETGKKAAINAAVKAYEQASRRYYTRLLTDPAAFNELAEQVWEEINDQAAQGVH